MVVSMLALLFTALAMIPAGAHLPEMRAKLALSRDDYRTVQQIYRGWSRLGVISAGALLAVIRLHAG